MDYLSALISRYPALKPVQNEINSLYTVLVRAFETKRKLLVAGNGGSASDSEHIAGELMKSFIRPRPVNAEFRSALAALGAKDAEHGEILDRLASGLQGALPVIALSNGGALSSAIANDVDAALVYAQQVYGYGEEGDVFLGISTSGNSKNILYAALCAKAKGLHIAALSGGTGGKLARIADTAVIVPERETYLIQELHLPIYHTIALMLEEHFFP